MRGLIEELSRGADAGNFLTELNLEPPGDLAAHARAVFWRRHFNAVGMHAVNCVRNVGHP